jgi:hypothetical protein
MAATALLLAVVTAATGPAPRDAIAGILAVARISGSARAEEAGTATIRAAVDAARSLQEALSARVPTWMILLLAILLLLIWLIYHAWNGWKLLNRAG